MRRILTLAVTLLLALGVQPVASASSPVGSLPQLEDFSSQARSMLAGRVSSVTSGAVSFEGLEDSQITTEPQHRQTLADFGQALTSRGVGYSRAEVYLLQPQFVSESHSKVILRATDHTKLWHASVPGVAEEHQVERDFTFVRSPGGAWTLSAESPTGSSGIAVTTDVGRDGRAQAFDATAEPELGPDDADPVVAMEPAVTREPMYDKLRIRRYALDHVFNPNSSYRTYDQDCTNFVSQAMHHGGWSTVNSGGRTSNRSWFYGAFVSTTAYSWAAAENWHQFARGSGRTYTRSDPYNLRIGEILSADWDRDGLKDHSMVVTTQSSSPPDIFLTYRSTHTMNRSFTNMVMANPNAWWYTHGW